MVATGRVGMGSDWRLIILSKRASTSGWGGVDAKHTSSGEFFLQIMTILGKLYHLGTQIILHRFFKLWIFRGNLETGFRFRVILILTISNKKWL